MCEIKAKTRALTREDSLLVREYLGEEGGDDDGDRDRGTDGFLGRVRVRERATYPDSRRM